MPVPPAAGGAAVPDVVAGLANGRAITLVWTNEVGGLTYAAGGDVFIKWARRGSGMNLHAEAERMRWAAQYTTVPRVLDVGDDEEQTWLVTSALPGESAVSERWRRDPATATHAVGAGLRMLHDALPVDACPYTWSASSRLQRARLLTSATAEPWRWSRETRAIGLERALGILAAPPPVDRTVVCHGDACAPNTIIDAYGRVAGHVDLERLGVADRWADLAIAAWSAVWNYGPEWEPRVLDAYGIDPDRERIAYYRLLWDLS